MFSTNKGSADCIASAAVRGWLVQTADPCSSLFATARFAVKSVYCPGCVQNALLPSDKLPSASLQVAQHPVQSAFL